MMLFGKLEIASLLFRQACEPMYEWEKILKERVGKVR